MRKAFEASIFHLISSSLEQGRHQQPAETDLTPDRRDNEHLDRMGSSAGGPQFTEIVSYRHQAIPLDDKLFSQFHSHGQSKDNFGPLIVFSYSRRLSAVVDMKRNSFKFDVGTKQKKSLAGSLAAVNSRGLAAQMSGALQTESVVKVKQDFNLPGCVWESDLSNAECCYHVLLQAQMCFIVVFVEEEKLLELAGILRHLAPLVIPITLNTQRSHIAKVLAGAAAATGSANKGGIILLSPQMAVFTESCLPVRLRIRYIVHIGIISAADFERRSLSERKVLVAGTKKDAQITSHNKTAPAASALHIHILSLGSIRLTGDIRRFDFVKSWTSLVQKRVVAARTLYSASMEGKTSNHSTAGEVTSGLEGSKSETHINLSSDSRKEIAAKVDVLKNDLRMLMSLPLSDREEKKVKIASSEMKNLKDLQNLEASDSCEEKQELKSQPQSKKRRKF